VNELEAQLVPITVCSWRITAADPSGMMMWFDPTCEVPLLGHSPPNSEDVDGFYEGGALGGTLREEGCVPCEGADSDTINREDTELPF